MPGKRWPHVRAGAIALVIAIGLVDGCPLPPAAYVEPWQAPIVDAIRPIQEVVMRPFAWVTRALRFSQRWALFQAARRDRYRLELQGRKAGGWTLMFRAGDADHAAYADLLLDERIRGAWNPTDHMMGQYGVFSHWFLGHVLDEHPELDAARLWFERIVIEDGQLTPTGAFVSPMVRERGAP